MESELDEVMSDVESDADIATVEGGDRLSASSSQQQRLAESTTSFTCGSHFYEEVEDSKDSIWLVLVVPPADDEHSTPLLDENQWRSLVTRVKPFGIRTGILNCQLDRRLCKKKGWHGHQIVLALPKGIHPKDNVVFHLYKGRRGPASALSVFTWVRKRLSSRVTVVKNADELERHWLNFVVNSDGHDPRSDIKVRVLLSTNSSTNAAATTSNLSLEGPPLAYSTLSMKFTGRISFGLVDRNLLQKSSLAADDLFTHDIGRSSLSTYVVLTPEGAGIYGERPGEHLTYKSMELYFRTLQPEMNDVFTLSLLVTNVLACLDFFAVRRKLWRHIVRCAWTLVKYNLLLFAFWIAVFGLSNRLTFVRIVSDFFLTSARRLARSEYIGSLRHHYRFWKSCPKVLFASFVALWFTYGAVRKNWLHDDQDDDVVNNVQTSSNVDRTETTSRTTTTTIRTPRFNFTGYLFSGPRINVVGEHAADIEEGLTQWIERLATPNFWLHPLIPYDYIKDLPTWRFRASHSMATFQRKSMSEASDDDDDDDDDGVDVDDDDDDGDGAAVDTINSNDDNDVVVSSSSSSSSAAAAASSSSRIGQRLIDWTLGKRRPSSESLAKRSSQLCDRAPADTKETAECAICLDFYVDGAVLCGLPCGHNYHRKCIVGWLERDHHNCPICRRPSYRC